MRLDKINALRRSLGAQQAAFTRPQTDGENITCASCVVSELIAIALGESRNAAIMRLSNTAVIDLFFDP